MGWFLYNRVLRHERVKKKFGYNVTGSRLART